MRCIIVSYLHNLFNETKLKTILNLFVVFINDVFLNRLGLLLRHQRELHQMNVDLPEDQRKYFCKIEGCGKKFSLQSDLNKHIFEHTGVHPYQCKECQNVFSSSGVLSLFHI